MSSINETQRLSNVTVLQKLHGYFSLARISNSPTVVSNVLVGTALAGQLSTQNMLPIVLIASAMVAFYTAGMYLNDICDYEFDLVKRSDRPLPSGLISRSSATAVTVSLFVLGSLLLLTVGIRPFLAGLVLIALIVVYDLWHKTNPLSPLLMASTRMMVYVIAFLAFSSVLTLNLLIAVVLLLSYIVGLTFIAKSETGDRFTRYWPIVTLYLPGLYLMFSPANLVGWLLLIGLMLWIGYSISFIYRRQNRSIGGAITRLIAGISLYDSLVITVTGALAYVLLAVGAFLLTLFLQRYIKGT
jgi:hypothetical protein